MLKAKLPVNNSFIDIIQDWDLIEISFMQAYHMRLRMTEMSYAEFMNFLQGAIMMETIIARVIEIRQKPIKDLTPEEHEMRLKYRLEKQFASNFSYGALAKLTGGDK